jgi:hypothetical protein
MDTIKVIFIILSFTIFVEYCPVIPNINDKIKENFAEFLTNGEIEHAYPLTKKELIAMGIPIKTISNASFMKNILKLISNNSLEGVHYV